MKMAWLRQKTDRHSQDAAQRNSGMYKATPTQSHRIPLHCIWATALSRDQEGIRKLAREGQIVSQPQDLLKEPLVLEFLGLAEQISKPNSSVRTITEMLNKSVRPELVEGQLL
jgi:predicted nuclease of restriction endonuclease-like (RecB) superfamily